MDFALNWKALGIASALGLFFYILYLWKKSSPSPAIFFSNVQSLISAKRGLRSYIPNLPNQLKYATLLCFMLAFVDPHFFIDKKPTDQSDKQKPPQAPPNLATEGIAIYLVLDQSGSMEEEVRALSPEGRPTRIKKKDLLKQVTRLFVQGDQNLGLSGRANDLIGLVTFARGAQIMAPLTLDHQNILDELDKFDIMRVKDQDGTAIGYAIFKTVNLIAATRNYAKDLIGKGKPAYEIKSSVILLVTDGLQDPNPLDNGKRWRQVSPMEASEYAKENNVRLYIVNVEPKLAAEEFSANRNQMRKAAEMTGGKFFMVDNSANLTEIYAEIDRLEKSKVPVGNEMLNIQNSLNKDQLPKLYKRISIYPYLIALGLLFFILSIFLETTLLRKVP